MYGVSVGPFLIMDYVANASILATGVSVINYRKGETAARYDKYRNGLVILAIAFFMATCMQSAHGV